MTTFDIETLGPTDGPCPTNLYDPDRLINFIGWKPDDEATCVYRIPYGYSEGSGVSLLFDELCPAAGSVYSWEASINVIQPGVCPIEGLSVPLLTLSSQFSVNEQADSIVTRRIAEIAPNGIVSNVKLTSGSLLSIGLKLLCPATGNCPTRLLTLAYRIEIVVNSEASNIGCVGRVANIIRETRDLFNEDTGDFLSDEFILRSINACVKDLSLEDYWLAETCMPILAGQENIDIFNIAPDLRKVLRARFDGQPRTLTQLKSLNDFIELTSQSHNSGTPEYYFIQNNMMRLWPVPTTSVGPGLRVYYSRLPEALGCAENNCDPPVPRAHDTLFTLFALKQAFLRDRNAAGADVKFGEYSQLYEIEKKRLLDGREPMSASLRPRSW